MSKLYSESNRESAKSLFDKRFSYEARLDSYGKANIVNFDFGEKMFYGRMDISQKAIVLRENMNLLSSLPNSKDKISNHKALVFVTEAFKMLRFEISKAANTGKIKPNDKYLSNLEVYRGYESPQVKYRQYLNIYKNKLSKTLKNKIIFNDMQEFLPQFLNISSQTLLTVPITYPGFIKSKYCDIMCTGLAIEIADLKYSDNHTKIRKFIESPNWLFFVNACNQYGFMIDMHRPWRIVADLDSDFMKQLGDKLGVQAGIGSLATNYKPAFTDTLTEFPALIANFYQSLKRKNYAIKKPCGHGKVTKQIITPKAYTPVRVITELESRFLVCYYLLLRILETRPAIPANNMNIILKDAIEAQYTEGSYGYVAMFEEIISKTFDKIGSIQYHTKMVQLSLNELRQRFPDVYVARDRANIGEQPVGLDDVLGHGDDY